MTLKHPVIAMFILALVISLAKAQSQYSPEQAAQEEAELKKARVARARKALAMVDEIVKETQSLKLAENRIRIQMGLADLLWQRDEQRAISLFNDAAAGLGEITAANNKEDSDLNMVQLASQMREEIISVVARHNARLAIDFLRATRPAVPLQGSAQPDLEAQLELRLASGVAGKDVNEAVRFAEESLKRGIDYEAINLLHKIYSSTNKAPADRLLASMLGRLRSEDFSRNTSAWYVAMTLLRTWSENNRIPNGGQRTTFNISLANLNDQAARDLSDSIISSVMNDGLGGSPQLYLFSGGNSANLHQITSLMPDMERLSPNQAGALKKKIAEFDRISELQRGPWPKYQQLIENGTPDDLLQASKQAPRELAAHLTQQAAFKALSHGDSDAAMQLASRIEDPKQRRETTLNIDRQLAQRLSEQGNLAEARVVLSRIPIEERAGLLAQFASRALQKKDKTAANQLLDEARMLLGERSANYQQLRVQFQIARGYAQLDSRKSGAIIEAGIEQLNELASAGLILNGFDLYQYFRDGEFLIGGNNPLCMIVREVAGELRLLAEQDFDRARSAAGRFGRAELRAMALLQIAQGSLTPDGSEEMEER